MIEKAKTFDDLAMHAFKWMADASLRYRPSNAAIGKGIEVLIHIERGPFTFVAGNDIENLIRAALEDFNLKYTEWVKRKSILSAPSPLKSVLSLNDLDL